MEEKPELSERDAALMKKITGLIEGNHNSEAIDLIYKHRSFATKNGVILQATLKGKQPEDFARSFVQDLKELEKVRIERLEALIQALKLPNNSKEEQVLAENDLIEFLYKDFAFTSKYFSFILEIFALNQLNNLEHQLKDLKKNLIVDALRSSKLESAKALAEDDDINLSLEPYKEILKKFGLDDDHSKICIYYGINDFSGKSNFSVLQLLINIADEFILADKDIKFILAFIRSTSAQELNLRNKDTNSTALLDAAEKWQTYLTNEQIRNTYETIIFELLKHGAETAIQDCTNLSFERTQFVNAFPYECNLRRLYYLHSPANLSALEANDIYLTEETKLLNYINESGERFLQKIIQRGEDVNAILAFISNTSADQLNAKDQSTALYDSTERWKSYYEEENNEQFDILLQKYHDIILTLLEHGANPEIVDDMNNKASDSLFFQTYPEECAAAKAKYTKNIQEKSKNKKISAVKIAAGIGLTVIGGIILYVGYNWLNEKNVNKIVNVK